MKIAGSPHTGGSALLAFSNSSVGAMDNGHTIYYDASASANSWLNGKTIICPAAAN
ncbi:hypothetical protein [Paenibacillus sp. BJ-4]|uniref:hypothetical protein n=1 Tax=Paenibacillus sp. BJ-4 TaxID=2878097 RepID=UPI001CF0216D|nr:hypothetical protein [Paenibacillus sp. BJ-4]